MNSHDNNNTNTNKKNPTNYAPTHFFLSFHSDADSGGTRHLFSFQPSDLSDAVTDIKWSPHDSNVFGSVTSDGRILIWDVRRIDPTIAHPIQPELTPHEQDTLSKAEADLEQRRERKLEREKQANDPLLALAMSMKQQKGEMTEEDLKPVDTAEELAKAEDELEQMRNKYVPEAHMYRICTRCACRGRRFCRRHRMLPAHPRDGCPTVQQRRAKRPSQRLVISGLGADGITRGLRIYLGNHNTQIVYDVYALLHVIECVG